MPDLHFKTQVSGEHNSIHYVRQTPLSELVNSSSFAAAIYYMITGHQPTPAQERVFNSLLIASMDHGINPASGIVPRVVASTGNNTVHSMAAGLLALGPYHGLAVEPAAHILVQVKQRGLEWLKENYFDQRKRVMGLGHPHYKHTDPRTDQLFLIAREAGISTEYQTLELEIQKFTFDTLGKHLVINIDGAMAALLLDLGFPAEAGNALFGFARAGGMIAHILEEMQEPPVRRLNSEDIEFDPGIGSTNDKTEVEG